MKRKSKILITGIAGFAGSHLAELLLSHDYEIYGLIAPNEPTDNIRQIIKNLELKTVDITDQSRVSRIIKAIKPEYIFHLAAMASVGQSIQKERLTYQVNIFGSLNILESALSQKNTLKKLVFISSSDCYGIFSPANKLLKETQLLNPISPYGISKATMEYIAKYYFRQYNLPVVIARSFNHTGPRQSDIFVVPSFCRQIALISAGLNKPEMVVGDLTVKRDLSDVRDIVKGYYLAGIKGKSGEIYQFSSNRAISIEKLLKKLLKISPIDIKVIIDKKRLRKSDIPILKGSNSKARKDLGWIPQIRLEKTLQDTLQYWRGLIRK